MKAKVIKKTGKLNKNAIIFILPLDALENEEKKQAKNPIVIDKAKAIELINSKIIRIINQ